MMGNVLTTIYRGINHGFRAIIQRFRRRISALWRGWRSRDSSMQIGISIHTHIRLVFARSTTHIYSHVQWSFGIDLNIIYLFIAAFLGTFDGNDGRWGVEGTVNEAARCRTYNSQEQHLPEEWMESLATCFFLTLAPAGTVWLRETNAPPRDGRCSTSYV